MSGGISGNPQGLVPNLTDKISNNLWLFAVERLEERDKASINFSYDKLTILSDLKREAEQARTSCDERRLTFKRKNGEKVILRDVFGKVVKWINLFKEVGDVAVSHDPGHAALPWALVRVLLQVSVSDIEKYSFVVESLEDVSSCISRCALLERLYLSSTAIATDDLRGSLVKTYGKILYLLFRIKRFFDSNKGIRIISSAFRDAAEFSNPLEEIKTSFYQVEKWASLVSREDDTTQYQELRKLLAKFNEPPVRVSSTLQQIHDNLEKSKRQSILKWLSDTGKLPYLNHHKESKREILEGTGQWLLQDDVFKKWKDDSASSLLWLHGIPGSGKSKLTSLVIEDGIKSSASGVAPRPAFVYCSRNPAEPLRSDPRSIISSITRQISSIAPASDLLSPVVEKYEEEEEAQGDIPSPLDIEEIQTLVLDLVNTRQLTIIIIDALDECSREGRHIVLDFIKCVTENASSLVKFFISSRRDEDIVFRLQHFPNMEISSTKNGSDVKAFVQWETKRLITSGLLLRDSQRQHELRNLIIYKVSNDADGMFRWASLQLQNLTTLKTDEDIQDHLGKLPPTLAELYADIYKQVVQNQGGVAQAIAKNVFCVLLGYRYTLDENDFLQFIRVNGKKVSTSQVLDICCNLVVLDKTSGIFRFAHLSVREFLQGTTIYSSTELIHSVIALCCLISTREIELIEDEPWLGSDPKRASLLYHLKRAERSSLKEQLLRPALSFLQTYQRYDKRMPKWLPSPRNKEVRCLLNACRLEFVEILEYMIDLANDEKVPQLSSIESSDRLKDKTQSGSENIMDFTPLDVARLKEALAGENNMCTILARQAIYYNQRNVLKLLLTRQMCDVSEQLMNEAVKFPVMEVSSTIELLLNFGGLHYVSAKVLKTAIKSATCQQSWTPIDHHLYSDSWKTSMIQALLERGLMFTITAGFQRTIEIFCSAGLDAYLLLLEADTNCIVSQDFMHKVMSLKFLRRYQLQRLIQRYGCAGQKEFDDAARYCATWGPLGHLLTSNDDVHCTPRFLRNFFQSPNRSSILYDLLIRTSSQKIWQLRLTQQVLECVSRVSGSWVWSLRDMLRILDANPSLDVCATVLLMASIQGYVQLIRNCDLIEPHSLATWRVLNDSVTFAPQAVRRDLLSPLQIVNLTKNIISTVLEILRIASLLDLSTCIPEDDTLRADEYSTIGQDETFVDQIPDDNTKIKSYDIFMPDSLEEETETIDNALKTFLASWDDSLALVGFDSLGETSGSNKEYSEAENDDDETGENSPENGKAKSNDNKTGSGNAGDDDDEEGNHTLMPCLSCPHGPVGPVWASLSALSIWA